MAKKDKDKVAINASFDFFKTVKTGDKFTDAGKKREINTWIDTGSYTLNALISGDMTKGFPGNRAVMLAGEEAVGKTFFAIYGFAKPLVDMGYFIFYVDTENAVTEDQLISFGLPEGSFKIISQDIVEDLKVNFDIILSQLEEARGKALTNKNKCAFIIDSQGMLDSMKARKDIKEENFVNDMTLQKELKRLYRSILVRMGELEIPMLITNHVYSNIGGYGDPKKVAGGSGGLYASSVILSMRKKQYKEGDLRMGTIITAKNLKSRICRDGLESSVYLNFERGLNKWYGLHLFAQDAGLIEKFNSDFEDMGVVKPKYRGSPTLYIIKDPKKEPKNWIVCKDTELHKASTIGTIFDEINQHVINTFKLLNPSEFDYGEEDPDEQDVEINEDNFKESTEDTDDTIVVKAKKGNKKLAIEPVLEVE